MSNDERIERLSVHLDQVDAEALVMLIQEARGESSGDTVDIVDADAGEAFTITVGELSTAAKIALLSRAMAIIVLTGEDRKREMIEEAPTELLRLATTMLRDYADNEHDERIGNELLELIKTRVDLAEAELRRRGAQQAMQA